MYDFEELLSRLPNCDRFPTKTALPNGIDYISEDIHGFIPRSLSVKEPCFDGGHPQVVIVSAPGAVGKSTLGQAIAFKRNALIWDLAKGDEVGVGSLDGILLNTFESGFAEEFFEYMSQGLQFVIVDALDEGRIKVNETAFRRLLENVSYRAKGSPETCFLLLGRTHIAEESWLALGEEGINTELLSIEPFNREQANQYIGNRVKQNNSQAYLECRDLIFEQLASAVGGETVDFLHYPPVLDVIATLLDRESNPYRLKNEISGDQGQLQGNSADLLGRVITSILSREHEEKLSRNVQGLLVSEPENSERIDLSSLYTVKEQCVRVLSSVLNEPVIATPSTVPERLIPRYEEAVASFLPEHPFLQGIDRFANTVFRSYLFASALKGEFGSSLENKVVQELLKRQELPTRLLSDFYFAGTSDAPAHRTEIHPTHLGLLYDSLISSESPRSRIRLNIDGPDPEDYASNQLDIVEGEFEIWSNPERSLPDRSIPFALNINRTAVISFSRSLRDASIVVPCTVQLGEKVLEFQFGPAVYIHADTLALKADSITVRAEPFLPDEQEDNDVVQLEANSCIWESSNAIPTLNVYNRGKFHVAWPGAAGYPWGAYQLEHTESDSSSDLVMGEVYRRFKRIAVEFRSHSRGGLARTKQKIDNGRVLQGRLGQALLRTLVEDEILILRDGGNRYYWNTETADELLGVTWLDLRQWANPPILQAYLSKFVQLNPDLFRA